MGTWGQKVKYQHEEVNLGLLYIIQAANKMLATKEFGAEKEPLDIIQGCWSGAAASAGTHLKTDALDVTPYNQKNRVEVFRKLGVAFYYRPLLPGEWEPHCHGITCYKKGAAASAQRQVQAYFNRRNALANNGPDEGYQMLVFPRFLFPETKVGKIGRFYLKVDTKAYDQPTEKSKVLGTLRKDSVFDVVAAVMVDKEVWVYSANGLAIKKKVLTEEVPGVKDEYTLNTKLPLQKGDRGWVVKRVQNGLNKEANAGLKVDGLFDYKTKQAVKAFQSKKGLASDGVIAMETAYQLARLGIETKNINRRKPKKGRFITAHISLQFSDSIAQFKFDLWQLMNANLVDFKGGKLAARRYEMISVTEVGDPMFWKVIQEEAVKYGYLLHKSKNNDSAILVEPSFIADGKLKKSGIPVLQSASHYKDVHHFGGRGITKGHFNSVLDVEFDLNAVHYLVESRYNGMSQKVTPGCTINHWALNRDYAEAIFKTMWEQDKNVFALCSGDFNMIINSKDNHPFYGLPVVSSAQILGKAENTGHGPIDGHFKLVSENRFKPVKITVYSDKELKFNSDHYLTVTEWQAG